MHTCACACACGEGEHTTFIKGKEMGMGENEKMNCTLLPFPFPLLFEWTVLPVDVYMQYIPQGNPGTQCVSGGGTAISS